MKKTSSSRDSSRLTKSSKKLSKFKKCPHFKKLEEIEEGVWEQNRRLILLKEQYRTAVEGSLVGIYILQDGVFKYVNPAFLKIFGYEKPEEITGRPWQEIVFKEDIEKVLATGIEERMKGKGEPVQYTFRAVKKNGAIIEAEILAQPSFYENKPASITSLLDITERKRAEEQVKQLQEYLQLQIDRMPIALIVWDTEFRAQSWNSAAERTFGFTAEEALGKHSYDTIVPKEAQPHVDNIWRRLLAGDMTAYSINENITKDGRAILCDWTNTPLKKADGAVVGVLSMVQDITERKKAEEKIKRLYRFQTIIRGVNQLIIRIKDEKKFFQQICDTLKEADLFKFVWIGLVEKETYEVKPAAQAGFEKDYLSSIKVTWDESEYGKGPTGTAIKSREPFVMADIAGDPRYKPWREQALKRGYLSSAAVPFVYEKEVIGTLNVYSDKKDFFGEEVIEFLKEVAGDIAVGIKSLRQKKDLEESEEKLRDFLENADDLIQKLDREGKFLYVNRKWRESLEYNEEDLLKMNFLDIVRKDYREHCVANFEKLSRGEAVDKFETVFISKTGKEIAVEGAVNSVLQDKKLVYTRCIFRDITARKHAETQIKKLDELKSRFITIVSHQLRTPLNSVRWNLENLLSGDMDHLPETQKKIVDISYGASMEVISRIDDLLLALDIEEGRAARISKNVTSLKSLWNSVMAEEEKRYVLKKITHEDIIPEKPLPAVSVDLEKIRLVFRKLCDNALDYTKEGGKITTILKIIDNRIRFEISDTGIGIPETEQSSIFERFYRASNAFTMKPDASGLGLFIAKYFIEQHGGKIGFESEEGRGSTFWFELPL